MLPKLKTIVKNYSELQHKLTSERYTCIFSPCYELPSIQRLFLVDVFALRALPSLANTRALKKAQKRSLTCFVRQNIVNMDKEEWEQFLQDNSAYGKGYEPSDDGWESSESELENNEHVDIKKSEVWSQWIHLSLILRWKTRAYKLIWPMNFR